MPVFAEQKETSSLDRVVEPSIDSSRADLRFKEEVAQQQPQVAPTTPDAQNVCVSISEKMETSEQIAPTEQTVIIFDWDDTLLASSFLSSQGYRLDTDLQSKENYDYVRQELQLLENCVITVLEEALKRAPVHIVTNAETGWVELSAQKFMPNLVPYFTSRRVSIISARSTYEHLYPDSPLKWKYSAMQDRLASVFALEQTMKNIISFGDSHVEREAVRTVTRGVSNTRTKSIKFAECPSTEQLRKQLELVTNCFNYICTHEGDLDLMLKMSVVTN